MNTAMIIELVVIVALLIATLAVTLCLRRRLHDYDGMGEVKRQVPHCDKPASKTL